MYIDVKFEKLHQELDDLLRGLPRPEVLQHPGAESAVLH